MKINGREWQDLSEQEKSDAIQNYINTFSGDDSFLEFIIFGKRPVRQLLAVEGAKGLKVKMSLLTNEDSGKMQLFPIISAVDKHGQELPGPDAIEFDEENDEEGAMVIMDDPTNPPVRCPTVCN